MFLFGLTVVSHDKVRRQLNSCKLYKNRYDSLLSPYRSEYSWELIFIKIDFIHDVFYGLITIHFQIKTSTIILANITL